MTHFYSNDLIITRFKKGYQIIAKALFLLGILTLSITSQARPPSDLESTPAIKKESTNTIQKASDCNASVSYFELNVNNIRTRINIAGDKWWDLQNGPKYEAPKIPNGSTQVAVHALFAGSLWIGGIDETGQLKLAAQTYRQTGNDFWAGPLDENGEVSAEICSQFDRAWEVTSTDIDEYLRKWDATQDNTLAIADIPTAILQWPGRNNPHFSDFELPADKNLAPFWDYNADGIYDPTQGDYPVMDEAIERVYPDQMFWWVFNDKGNAHTETGAEAIGLEIGALAFAFATADELNDMTFYKYRIENLSSQRLDSTYFGNWADPDLGQYDDDFVGCVPAESLGIVYNGTAVDGEYGENPPMLAIDILEGPKRQIGIDSTTQTPIWERMGMSSFLYYNSDRSIQGNPENAQHFYHLLAGRWKDGRQATFGGNGATEGAEPTGFMFPDDPKLPLPAWSECSENNTPADRRFLQSTGPFTFLPGAVNDMTVNVIWTDNIIDYPCPSFDPIIRISRKVQARFDNQFALKRGPDAPDLTISHFNQGISIELSNKADSNNAMEDYVEEDVELAAQGFENSVYTFQGYRIYQLADASVSPGEYNDPSRAREVAVVDIVDQITAITNYTYDKTTGEIVEGRKVLGRDSGISQTFEITKDLFAEGTDNALINHQEYYYSAVAYAYNAHTPYNAFNADPSAQLEPYLESSRNIQVYIGKPNYAIGLEEESPLAATSIYPNPFYRSNGGNVQLTNLPKDCTISLFTTEGRQVQTIQSTNQSPLYLQNYLDKMTMTRGMYFIQVSLPESQQTRTFKWYYIAD